MIFLSAIRNNLAKFPSGGWLTDFSFAFNLLKMNRGCPDHRVLAAIRFLLCLRRLGVVQLVGHQTLTVK